MNLRFECKSSSEVQSLDGGTGASALGVSISEVYCNVHFSSLRLDSILFGF